MKNITILITVLLRYKCVNELLESILNQGYNNLNILVVDDSDKSIYNKIKYKDKFNNFDYYKVKFDSGLSRKRNFGIKKLKTDYFVIMDDDSLFTEDSNLEEYKRIYDKNDYDILGSNYGGYRYVKCCKLGIEGNAIVKYEIDTKNKESVEADFIQNCIISKKSIFERKDIKWRDELKIGEHISFSYDMWLRDDVKLGFTDKIHFSINKRRDKKSYKYKQFRYREEMFKSKYFFGNGNKHGIKRIKTKRFRNNK